jgi:hypothetical protein
MNMAVLSRKNSKDEACLVSHRCLIGFDKKEGKMVWRVNESAGTCSRPTSRRRN